jgi:uncharacterized membrane protein
MRRRTIEGLEEHMQSYHPPAPVPVLDAFHATLRAFPIACFSLALLTDIAYTQTSELMWLHFSEWLLLAGLVAGAFALIAHGVEYLLRRVRPSWLAVLGAVVVMVLATINSLVHTNDGWTAVVPWGLTLSAVTVFAMIVTAWLARAGVRHV